MRSQNPTLLGGFSVDLCDFDLSDFDLSDFDLSDFDLCDFTTPWGISALR